MNLTDELVGQTHTYKLNRWTGRSATHLFILSISIVPIQEHTLSSSTSPAKTEEKILNRPV